MFLGIFRLHYFGDHLDGESRLSYLTRVACLMAVTISMVFGPIGCGEQSGPGTGTTGQLPPEAKQSNKSMEDFMKNQDATKKK